MINKKAFKKRISEEPNVKIHVRENVDYSRSEIVQPGFIAKAVGMDENQYETEFASIDDIYRFAKNAGFAGDINICITAKKEVGYD